MSIFKPIRKIVLQQHHWSRQHKQSTESWFQFFQRMLQETKTNTFYRLYESISDEHQDRLFYFLFILHRTFHKLAIHPNIRIDGVELRIHFYDADAREWLESIVNPHFFELNLRAQKSKFYPNIRSSGDLILFICRQINSGQDFKFVLKYQYEFVPQPTLYMNLPSAQMAILTPTQLRFEELNLYCHTTDIDVLSLGLFETETEEDGDDTVFSKTSGCTNGVANGVAIGDDSKRKRDRM